MKSLTLCSKCQIDGEEFIIFCDLLRKHELYILLHILASDKTETSLVYVAFCKEMSEAVFQQIFTVHK